MSRFAAKLPLYAWVGLCLAMTVLVLVIDDWSAEQAAWVTLDAAGFPVWAIISGIAIGWLRNPTFWSWLVIVGFGSGWFWYQAKGKRQSPKPMEQSKKFKGKQIWYSLLSILPVASASDIGNSQYRIVDGVYQELPFSFEGALIGFFTGLVLSGLLYVIGVGVSRLFKAMRSRPVEGL
jgi:hypothetical protein